MQIYNTQSVARTLGREACVQLSCTVSGSLTQEMWVSRGSRNPGVSHQTRLAFCFESLPFLPNQVPTTWPGEDSAPSPGLQPHSFKQAGKKTRHLLGLPSVEINKVLDLQTCWYGDLNDMTKGWMGRKGGGRQIGGPPCPPADRPRCLQSRSPETCNLARASPFLKGPLGATGSPRSRGLGA